jgi:hypothetical protein
MVYDESEWGMCLAPTRHVTKVRLSTDSPHRVVIPRITPEFQYPWFCFYCPSLFPACWMLQPLLTWRPLQGHQCLSHRRPQIQQRHCRRSSIVRDDHAASLKRRRRRPRHRRHYGCGLRQWCPPQWRGRVMRRRKQTKSRPQKSEQNHPASRHLIQTWAIMISRERPTSNVKSMQMCWRRGCQYNYGRGAR